MMQKNILAISPQEDYLKTLAAFIFGKCNGDLLALARMSVILPNRRSVLKIKEDFVELSPKGAIILPRIFSLGDLDEESLELNQIVGNPEGLNLKAPLDPNRRLLLLGHMIKNISLKEFGLNEISFDAALKLGYSLGQILDDISRNELGPEALEKILPDELSQHKQVSLDFIRFVCAEYPKKLDELDVTDHSRRTIALINIYAEYIFKSKPLDPIFIAGTTGSVPATRMLMKTISGLENGYIILPYIDMELNSFEWEETAAKGNEINHQSMMNRLLNELEITREEISIIGKNDSSNKSRVKPISEMMKPFSAIDSWRKMKDVDLSWITVLNAGNNINEAKLASVIIRHKLHQNKSIALVTNNRDLAEKVRFYLKRFNINIDDSSGQNLDETREGRLFLSVAELISSDFRISYLLPLLKNGNFKDVYDLERNFIRRNNIKHLNELLLKINPLSEYGDLLPVFREINNIAEKLASGDSTITGLIIATYEILNILQPGINLNSENWQAIEQLADNIAPYDENINVSLYAESIKIILKGKKIWPKYIINKDIAILSHIEARLQHYDCIILADLLLGSWPAGKFSPWLSKNMFKSMELPSEEESFALAAHDFAFHLHKSEVFITLSDYNGGEPMIESPFVTKLKTFCKAIDCKNYNNENIYKYLIAKLDGDFEPRKTQEKPYPILPENVRINRLSVTKIETLLKNPYAIYASEILKLRRLDDLEREAEARDCGNFCHKVLEEFTLLHGLDVGMITIENFNSVTAKVYTEYEKMNLVDSAWLTQLKEIAPWYVSLEKSYIPKLQAIIPESKMEYVFDHRGSIFTLVCKADRIEVTNENHVNIADYKTGYYPNMSQVNRLISPQIPLTALILKNNCHDKIKLTEQAYEFGNVIYYNFSFSNKGPQKKIYEKIELGDLITDTERELSRLIDDLQGRDTPYLIRPNPKLQPEFDDYEHLERWVG